jgi:CarboxypepD_reg-like domain
MVRRLRLLLISLFLICQSNFILIYPQEAGYIDGKVINPATSKPVPFATIKLKNNQLGVYANADGDFKISRNAEFQEDSLLISCIGYKQSSIAFKDLIKTRINKVFLASVVYGLGEVKVVASVRKLNSIAIIRRAIRNIADNYPDQPFSYISYYRDYQKKDSNYINLNEAIVQTLDNGFSTQSASNKYRLLDFRKNTEFPKMNISPYYKLGKNGEINDPDKTIPSAFLGDQFGNELFILMVHNALRNFKTRSFSFIETFATDFIPNHTFSEPEKVFNNNLLLYKIGFEARRRITGDSLQASGFIYIQPKDYSIHKLEYSCYYSVNGKKSQQMFNIDVEYGYESSDNSLMCLKYISFNNYFRVVDSTDNTSFKILDSSLDTTTNINPTVIVQFNNKIDPASAAKKSDYEIISGKKAVKINGLQVKGKYLYIRLKVDDIKGRHESIKLTISNIRDVDGNVIGKRKSIDLYQYRELFVQEYNKPLPLKDSCYMQYLPLEKNCISKYNGNEKYWMNTPENIKVIR